MTPQLQMAIKLLQLSRLELLDTIAQELEENPALEEMQDTGADEQLSEPEETPTAEQTDTPEVTIDEKLKDDIDWSNYLDEYNTPGRTHFESEDRDTPKFEAFIARKESLKDHLQWQLLMTKPTRKEEEIASLIVGNLNKDGYLDVPVDEIAKTGLREPEFVEELLLKMQTFDPVGVCARNLSECLLIQARHLGLDNTIITEIITNHLSELEKKNYKVICKYLKISMDEVVSAVNVIKSMEPKFSATILKTSSPSC